MQHLKRHEERCISMQIVIKAFDGVLYFPEASANAFLSRTCAKPRGRSSLERVVLIFFIWFSEQVCRGAETEGVLV